MSVGLVARNGLNLAALAADLEQFEVPIITQLADVANTEQLRSAIRACISRQGTPQAVVYNAGLIQVDSPGDLSAEEQTAAWSVNVLGALTTSAETMPLMAQDGVGTFMITGGMPEPVSGMFSLSLGKAGVRAVTAMLAEHFGPSGIHVATVTVGGPVAPETAFDPDRIAEHYWRLHVQAPHVWETEYLFRGSPVPTS